MAGKKKHSEWTFTDEALSHWETEQGISIPQAERRRRARESDRRYRLGDAARGEDGRFQKRKLSKREQKRGHVTGQGMSLDMEWVS